MKKAYAAHSSNICKTHIIVHDCFHVGMTCSLCVFVLGQCIVLQHKRFALLSAFGAFECCSDSATADVLIAGGQ